jgi:hypothetical protein
MTAPALDTILSRYAPPNSPLWTVRVVDSDAARSGHSRLEGRAGEVFLTRQELKRFSAPARVQLLPLGEASGGTVGGILVQGLRLADVDAFALARLGKHWLMPAGCLVLSTEVDSHARQTSLGRLSHLRSLLGRCGFQVTESTAPAPAVAAPILVCTLTKEVSAGAERLEFDDSAGVDFQAFRRLFQAAFSGDYDESLWQWKYGLDRGRAVVARRGAELVAFYGSTERMISYFGRAGTALQICDVMVLPKERGILTRRGAMFCTGAAFAEAYLGVAEHSIGYGFPTTRHMLLGNKVGLYAEVAKMVELRWGSLDEASPSSLRLSEVDLANEPRCVRYAWRRMRTSLAGGICVRRDGAYLRYRYRDHPLNEYSVFCVRRGLFPMPVGLIVLRRHETECELLDVVGPLKQMHVLVDAAKRQARDWGCAQLYCWISDGYVNALSDDATEQRELGISVPTSIWVEKDPIERLAGKWFLMSGDTEFR